MDLIRLHKIEIGLTALALIVRLVFIDSVPPSLSMDEVAIGYNAYSILHTGRDEWGSYMPLAFKSVGDFKPPVAVYLTVPFVMIFGLTEIAVRLPVVLFGSFTIIAVILLMKEIGISRRASYFAGFWLAINPWHVYYSRGGFEAVIALFFVIAGTVLFIRSVKHSSGKLLTLSAVFFGLSVWTYHAQRVFTPLLVIFLLFHYRHKVSAISKHKQSRVAVTFVLSVLLLPYIYLTIFTPAVRQRALSTSVLREESVLTQLNEPKEGLADYILKSDIYVIGRHISGKYLNYFELRFLFWKTNLTPPEYPGLGLLYTADLGLVLLGFYYLLAGKSKYKALAIFWFFAGPLPASMTMNEQHGLRALVWLPAFAIFIAMGFAKLSRTKRAKPLLAIYALLLALNMVYASDIYFRQFPRFKSEYWQYGYKQVALYACANEDKYNEIVITDTFGSDGPLNTGIPYMYVLFYCGKDPSQFQETRTLPKYTYRRPDWKNDKLRDNTLLVGSPWDYLSEAIPSEQIVDTIEYMNGNVGFILVETGNK